MAEALLWHPCRLREGHGVASGRSSASPYPAGTIALQSPLFAARGIDLSPYYPGTLNLGFDDTRWQLSRPDARVEQLHWTDRHPPETFSFWSVALRWQGQAEPVAGLIYWPHPETKRAHHQDPDRLEVLAPWISGIASAQVLELGVDPGRCRRIRPRRLQAQLLEACKFRVLASQEAFFADFERGGQLVPASLRHWLQGVLPQALALSDAELAVVLARARDLYCESGPNGAAPNGAARNGIDGDKTEGSARLN
jgi:hypothetical protein